MIGNLKPYAVYKDSGVPWIGEVPKHWKVQRLGSLLKERHETNAQGQVTEVLSLLRNRGVIPYSEKGRIGNKKSEDITRYKIVRPNDIVVNCMNVIIGSVGLSKYTGCLSPVYYVLTRCSEYDNPHYLNAYFQNAPFQESLVRIGNGILSHRMRIPMELLKCEPFPRPPAEEQAAIATFLDYADRRIRRYIRSKQKLIKLLEEEKQVVINEAVTRGLDPNVPMKRSGIEWLGDVPEHWKMVPLKGLSNIQTGITLGKQYFGQELIEFPYLRVANVQAGYVNLSKVKTIAVPYRESERSFLQVGDVLMTEGGDPDKLGRGCVWDGQVEPCLHQNHIFAVRPKINRLRPRYLAALLASQYSKNYFLRTAKQTTNLASTNKTNIGQFPVLLPEVEEQDSILEKLETDLAKMEQVLSRIHQEISFFREFRTRLIADIVTGKLDVREAAAKLPVEVDELEALEEDLDEDVMGLEDELDPDAAPEDDAA